MKISKTFQIALISAIIFILLLIFLPGVLIPTLVSSQIKSRTQYKVDFGNVNISLLSGLVQFKDVKLENSNEFSIPDFLHVNEFTLKLDPFSLFKETIVIDKVIVNIQNVAFVEGQDKKNNMELFMSRLDESFGSSKDAPKEPRLDNKEKSQSKKKKFLIKHLSFQLHSLKALLDNGSKDPIKAESNWSIQKEYSNITQDNLKEATLPLSVEIGKRGISLLGQIVLQKATSILPDPQSVGQGLKNIGEGAINTVSEAVGGLKNIFSK